MSDRSPILAAACAASFLLLAASASAQTAPAPSSPPAVSAPSARTPAARAPREPSAGQMAARERQKKCGVEWRDAKAGGKTAGQKWPQFWSKCNARLKGNTA